METRGSGLGGDPWSAGCLWEPESDPARVGQRRMAGPLGDVSHRSERPGEDGGNVGSKGLTLF